MHAKSLQRCLTLCNSMDYTPLGSSGHGILQEGILECVVMASPRDLPDPGIEPVSLMSPTLAGGFFITETPRKSQYISKVTGIKGLLWWLSGKECRRNCRRRGFHPWVRKIPWRRKWQPTPVFLPVKSRQWSLVGYSPWSRKELDSTPRQQQKQQQPELKRIQ